MKLRDILKSGEVFAKRHRQGVAHAAHVTHLAQIVLRVGHKSIDAVAIRMKAIITQLETRNEVDDQAGADPKREPKDIYEGSSFVPGTIAPGDLEMVFQH